MDGGLKQHTGPAAPAMQPAAASQRLTLLSDMHSFFTVKRGISSSSPSADTWR